MVYETKEQLQRRKQIARFKLRVVIRKVVANKTWLSEEIDGPLGDNVKRNVAIILNRRPQRGIATRLERIILNTLPCARTDEELQKLEKLFDQLPCFSTFSPGIRQQLTRAVQFYIFPKDKILYLEGDPPLSMSFILSGDVLVTRLKLDKELNRMVDEPINTLGTGDYFGHIGLLHNDMPRSASCKTKNECELLLLHKEDFKEILKSTLEAKHATITTALRRFEYFNNYTDAKLSECCVISKIAEYAENDIIYSQHDIRNFSFFVLCGKCMILQCLKMREKPNGKCELVVAKKKSNPLELAIKQTYKNVSEATGRIASIADGDDVGIKYQFVDVATLSVGAVFGIHENIENRVIIAKTRVQCLLIPRVWLFKKAQNVGNVWQRLKLFLNSSIPSQEQLFEEYLKNLKWKKYKKKTIDQIRLHDNISHPETQYYNIPVMCRIQEQ